MGAPSISQFHREMGGKARTQTNHQTRLPVVRIYRERAIANRSHRPDPDPHPKHKKWVPHPSRSFIARWVGKRRTQTNHQTRVPVVRNYRERAIANLSHRPALDLRPRHKKGVPHPSRSFIARWVKARTQTNHQTRVPPVRNYRERAIANRSHRPDLDPHPKHKKGVPHPSRSFIARWVGKHEPKPTTRLGCPRSGIIVKELSQTGRTNLI